MPSTNEAVARLPRGPTDEAALETEDREQRQAVWSRHGHKQCVPRYTGKGLVAAHPLMSCWEAGGTGIGSQKLPPLQCQMGTYVQRAGRRGSRDMQAKRQCAAGRGKRKPSYGRARRHAVRCAARAGANRRSATIHR